MPTECNQESFPFHPLVRREVRGRFDEGAITSDAGGLLLREVEKRTGILAQFAACFTDHRDPARIEHPIKELVAQRVYGLALGYEDLNDHEELRRDPLLAVLVEKADLTGEARKRERDAGQALAGKSTLNRLELTGAAVSEEERYKKIALDEAAADRMLVAVFLAAHREAPPEIILDLDCTDNPLHGEQEGRFFHGYYGHYCYLPLYIFCREIFHQRATGQGEIGVITLPRSESGSSAKIRPRLSSPISEAQPPAFPPQETVPTTPSHPW